jgi:hypothetical protein
MARPEDIFCWTASVVVDLIALWVVWDYVVNADNGEPIIQVVPLVFAGAVWLLARLFRSWLAEP